MDVALSHGDLDAIQTLVKSAIFKDDEATLKKYLKVLPKHVTCLEFAPMVLTLDNVPYLS